MAAVQNRDQLHGAELAGAKGVGNFKECGEHALSQRIERSAGTRPGTKSPYLFASQVGDIGR
jgi:hypothetical protein